jgi:hypothetical protein
LLAADEVLEAVETLAAPDRVVDIDDGLLRIECEHAPRTDTDLDEVIDRGLTLARRIDAAASSSEDS